MGGKQAPGHFFQSISEELDAVLNKYYDMLPPFGDPLISEEHTIALVREIGKFANLYLKEGVGVAFARKDEEAAGSIHSAADLREMTLRALKYFVQALGTPLLPIMLKSRMKSWASIEPLVDETNARLRDELAEWSH